MNLERKKYYLCNLKDSNKSTYGKRKGDAGVTYAKYRAKMDGYIVCSEDSDSYDFDFTVFNNGKHYSVQAKATTYGKTQNTSRFTPVKRVRRFQDNTHKDIWMPYKDVDIFAFIDLRFEIIAWIPFENIENSKKTLGWHEFERWTLNKIIGEPDKDLDIETYDDETIISDQQDLF